MTKILHIQASPRQADSKSNEIARARIDTLRQRDRSLVVDTLDLWREPLPEFDGNSAAAKMTFFGIGQLDGANRTAWDRIVEITERFKAADHYVLGVPMWNGGIPYRLKLYIDIITQPGLLFGFDPAKGYFGLLKGKKATVVYSSGVFAPGAPPEYGLDFQSNYLDWWLRFIGVADIQTIRYQPSLLTQDPAKGLHDATEAARKLAA
ncbi:MAG TPA: NAD(P)H-dependent oxidoreductase [Bradyrhizobium sp.]|nr:NAD(P)H-dependent oxidoreductase [Bradyrhizobium sp.]